MEFFGYSLWLQPEGEDYQEFSSLIKQLAAKYHGPVFEPHVTLLGGFPQNDEQQVIFLTQQLAKRHTTFAIQLKEIDYEDFYFRTLFIHVEKTPELLKLNSEARKLFGISNEPPFMPHLSILYGEYPNETKEKIIGEIGREHNLSFYPSVITVIHSSGRENTWKVVGKLPFAS
ncbi:MAG TPA: 2'-5' RNA ligase family protein [Patescibacteria group bacterium]|nr:2'-5' RNA ligase family protein [Patescibacteria group bacterium]